MDSSSSDSRSDYEIRQFKFDELPDYAEISSFKPQGFKTPEGSFKISSWRDAYRIFCRYLLKEKPRHLRAFKNLEETFLGRRVMFSNDPFLLTEAYQLRSGFYAEIFLPPKSIIHNISRLIQFCRLSPRQFVVTIPVYVDESELSEPEEVEDDQNEVESQLAESEQPEEDVSEGETIQESVSTQPSSQILHFTLDDDIPDLAFSKPVSITINTNRYSVSKWRDIVSETARYVYENDAESFLRYLYKNFGPKGNSRPLFSDKSSNLLQASRIDSNLYVETNFSSVDCVKKALLFIRYANIPQSKVQIEYLPAGAVNSNNLIPAESANINTEPEEELENVAVVENNTSEQSQTETEAIESEEDNGIPNADARKSEEFENDKKDDDFVDDNEVGFSNDDLEMLSFTLDDPIPDLKFSKPTSISFGEQIVSISTWTDVLMKIVRYIVQNEPDAFNDLVLQYGDSGTGNHLFSRFKFEKLTCKQINSDYYLNTNFSSTGAVKQAQILMQSCKLPLSEVRIEYYSAGYGTQNRSASRSLQVAADNASFTKPVNKSMFNTCIVVPTQCHQAFYSNLTRAPEAGTSVPVTILLNGLSYSAAVLNPDFSGCGAPPQVRFTWNPSSSIAHALIEECPESYRLFQSGARISRQDAPDTITVSCGNKLDEFILQVNSQKASGVIQVENQLQEENSSISDPNQILSESDMISEQLIDEFGFTPEERNELVKQIEELVPEVFPNGSCREAQLQLLLDRLECLTTIDSLERFLIQNNIAILSRGWLYFLTDKVQAGLFEVLRQMEQEGQILADYNLLYEKKLDLFDSINVYKNEDVISKLFIALMAKNGALAEIRCYPTDRWLALKENATIKDALIDCFSRQAVLSYYQLNNELPYIPIDECRYVISHEPDFIKVVNNVYTIRDRIIFDDQLRDKLNALVQSEVEKNMYISCARLDLSEAMEFNPEISQSALLDYYCQELMPKRYKRKGNVISDAENPTDSSTIISSYCQSKSCVTYDELKNLAFDLSANEQTALYIATDLLVRVDKDHYIDPKLIHFDVDEIDRVLDTYIQEDYIPLQDVYSFSSFPICDSQRPWNWFLLESFCRKYSKQFGFMVAKINSKNVGVIVRKSAKYDDYYTLMATAVIKSEIELSGEAISRFLFQGHYIAVSNSTLIQRVLEKARILSDSEV